MFEENEYPADSLVHMEFHTFGMGDTSYRHFNKCAKDIEAKFVELGATKKQDIGLGNDQDDDKLSMPE